MVKLAKELWTIGITTNSGTDEPNQNPLELESANGYNKLNAVSVGSGEMMINFIRQWKILSCGRQNWYYYNANDIG